MRAQNLGSAITIGVAGLCFTLLEVMRFNHISKMRKEIQSNKYIHTMSLANEVKRYEGPAERGAIPTYELTIHYMDRDNKSHKYVFKYRSFFKQSETKQYDVYYLPDNPDKCIVPGDSYTKSRLLLWLPLTIFLDLTTIILLATAFL